MTTTQRLPARHVAPLSLAGFTTAFGAHGVGSVLGAETDDIGLSLLGLGIVLALYDVAEVVLKPVFGALSDRVGAKPVIVAGLLGFALASLLALVVPSITVLAVARVGQGAAAAAFSPASSATVARLAGTQRLGRYFGRYGAWKSLGYVLGPLLGILLVETLDIRALYLALAVLAVVAAAWVVVSVPALAPQPRPRYTLVDLVRQTTDRSFLVPTVVLASTTAVLGVAVGFLPLLATRLDLPAPVGAAAIAVLALVSTVVQPRTGRLRDAGRITTRAGSAAALAGATAVLVVVAVAPNAVTLFLTAVVFGAVVGVVTPLAFAHLAAATPEERMGRTMGNAELGREVGDAGGPLLVGAVAAAWTLPAALGVLAATTAGAAVVGWVGLRERERRRG
ncbi:MFS family permease [Curtobacterium luteum]|uniref:MFS family permease n=1 Tax=Curtobacterium luteum TaxID=33881 RepID=A0A8H9L182_9MICO|nr:MFS transporter [Curtobacterium luteum]MBM7801550.1 MFS family permease [Curtobacterium luteum]NUU52124.1 MFS transporter [Curtobacterium luteum]GGK89605.1 tetracycline resistance MFS efflux pump [Curtobacterium luteum]